MSEQKAASILGITLLHNTEFGRALLSKLPKMTTRVIIDIPVQDVVKIYYETINAMDLLDLKWGDELGEIQTISSDEPKKESNKP